MKDYYKILEIHPEASLEVLNKAYRALVQKYHPDLYHVSDKALMQEKMKDINEAYEILSNEHTRKDYDKRYRAFKVSEKPEVAQPELMERLKKLIFWGLITFVTLKFLIRPILVNPSLRIIVLGLVIIIAFRMYAARRSTR